MRMLFPSGTFVLVLVVGATGGCGSTNASPAVEEGNAELHTGAPTTACGVMFVQIGPIKIPINLGPCPLDGENLSGTWPKDAGADADPTACHGCRFTLGQDIQDAGFSRLLSGLNDGSYLSSLPQWDEAGGLRQAYQDVVAGAEVKKLLDEDVGKKIEDRLKAISAFLQPLALGGVEIPEPAPVSTIPWARAFASIHGRHLVEAITKDAAFAVPEVGWVHHSYTDPQCIGELRWRGARSYCAMREAAFGAGGARLSLGSWEVGEALFWKLGGVDASLRLPPPAKDLDASSAHTFAIPLRLGGNLTPARGPVLPDFGELSHPLVWITGDAEVLSRENFGLYFGPPKCIGRGGPCLPNPRFDFRELARNLKHVDVLAGSSATGSLKLPEILFATFGPVQLFVTGTITISLGVPDETNHLFGGAAAYPVPPPNGPWPANLWPPARASVLDLGGFPGPASDAPLVHEFRFLQPVENGTPYVDWNVPIQSAAGDFLAFGTFVRWQNDDDRSIVLKDEIRETMTLLGKLGFSLGPVHATVDGASSLNALSSQAVAFREHLSAVDVPIPRLAVAQTNVVVVAEPHSEVTADPLTVTLHLSMTIDTPFGPIVISWSQRVLKLPSATLAAVEVKPQPEAQRLRVGEFSEFGPPKFDGAGEQPLTYSHLPGDTPFTSFPGTIATCLQDPAQPPPTVDEDGPTAGDPPVQGELCAVGIHAQSGPLENLGQVPPSVCDAPGAIQSYVAGYPCGLSDQICQARRQCLIDTLGFLCRDVKKVQVWSSESVISHVLLQKEHAEIGGILQQCAAAFAAGQPGPAEAKSAMEDFLNSFVTFNACTADGTLLGVP